MSILKINISYLLYFLVFIIGITISFIRASNFSDGDSYSVILAFLDFFRDGSYSPSRGAYGHPIPEIIVGLTTYFLGTPFSNLICFVLFFLSIIFLIKTFFPNDIKKSIFFFILVFSNYLLFIENTNSIDYPFAIFFLSLGLFYLLEKKNITLSCVFFGLCVSSRLNFGVFILLIFFFHFLKHYKNFNDFKKYFFNGLIIIFINIFFYFPVFIENHYTFSFIKFPFQNDINSGWYGGPDLNVSSLLPRFVYKVYLITGSISSFVIFIVFISYVKKIFQELNFNHIVLISIILTNLITFFFMPTKTLIINPYIICLYIILVMKIPKKYLNLIIFINLFQWLLVIKFIDVKYKNQEICFQKEAIAAYFKINIEKGPLLNIDINNNLNAKCYANFMGKYKKPFLEGKPLINSN